MFRSLAVVAVFVSTISVLAHAEENKVATASRESENRTDYKLSDVKPGSVYDKLGLKNGDIIQDVNGKPATPREILDGFNLSKNPGKTLVLKIKREGKILELQYPIKTKKVSEDK